ncbi:MAG: hypothetical protein V4463_22700 [Pseudomonadota bacterium]
MLRACAFALLFAAANAGAQAPSAPPREHRGPPQEAFDACKGKKDGDAVQARMPRGDTVAGTCRLVMVPNHGNDDKNAPKERPPAK